MNLSWIRDPQSPWWNVANVAGTWFAAIGSIGTAVVALWLAYKDRRILLQLIATIGKASVGDVGPDVFAYDSR
jgi:hypothetical protein